MAAPKTGPSLAPMMTVEAPPSSPDSEVSLPDPHDDIADPPVPEAVQAALVPDPEWLKHEALLQGAMQALMGKIQPELHSYMKHADAAMSAMMDWAKSFSETEQAKLQQAQAMIAAVAQHLAEKGVQLRHDPYVAELQAVSPHGYPVLIRVAKGDTAALIAALPALTDWLAAQSYKPV